MFDSNVEIIKKIEWNGEDCVEIYTDMGVWAGAKRKDFWCPDENWEKMLTPGVKIRLWTVQWSTVLGFEAFLYDAKKRCLCWRSVWCHANDFQTKAERKKSEDGYVNFIEEEGVKIAGLIDEGKPLDEINGLISKDHSGNTHACALSIGIQKAKNRENADTVRKQHNKEWGVEDSKGLVNPAVVTLGTK